MATLYTTDGRTEQVRPSNGVHWTLEELQGLVGGYIEVVRTVDDRYMVINEEGKILRPPLALNIAATRLYRNGRIDVILGNAVVVDTMLELDGPEETDAEETNEDARDTH